MTCNKQTDGVGRYMKWLNRFKNWVHDAGEDWPEDREEKDAMRREASQ